MTIKTILAAVDRFPVSDDVLARAHALARAHDALLHVVHVVEMTAEPDELEQPDTVIGQAALAARDRIGAALARLGPPHPCTEVTILAGSPALALIDLCRAAAPDLVVMRAHQRDGLCEAILGSVSDRMVAAAVAPVLVVRRAGGDPYAQALVATNGEDGAGQALAFTAQLLPGADIRAVQAVQITPQLKEAMLRSGTDRAALEAHRAGLIRAARSHLAELAAGAPRRIKVSVLRGDPATALARATRIASVDLIAVGPGRAGLIRRAFTGSVTRRLLRDAACDVLVCYPAAEAS
ncbi:universal stress protein [Roseovarius dicentrarchi]|uniref:universal stress protein n=1 Tax=Roseovarius dicentrarchi TaxID=2250573 RepID=UPI000DE872CC|nr:universal stress protein [Roseovarius dicentrarchi]